MMIYEVPGITPPARLAGALGRGPVRHGVLRAGNARAAPGVGLVLAWRARLAGASVWSLVRPIRV